MNRKSTILDIRPPLGLGLEAKGHLESFQNTVLRPILKFQNDLILEYLHTHPQFIPQASKINKEDDKSAEGVITKFIKTNHAFRNKLYGMVSAMMTVEEYRVYNQDLSEYNRRIVTMYIERVLSQI